MGEGEPIRILLAASEVVGFAKTGGLADVAGSLPSALARRGHRCAVIMPLHRGAAPPIPHPIPTDRIFSVPVGDRVMPGRSWRVLAAGATCPCIWSRTTTISIATTRPMGRGIYQYTQPDGTRRDYPDNCERFVFFNRAVLEAMPLLDFWPDVLHVNDWQTGLIPVYAARALPPAQRPPPRLHYDRVRTLLTIHNIAFQGVFWHWDMQLTGLDWQLFNSEQLEYHGKLNFLKAGIVFADLHQHRQPDLRPRDPDALLRLRPAGRAVRQPRIASPASSTASITPSGTRRTTPTCPPHYGPDALEPGKPPCKAALQARVRSGRGARRAAAGRGGPADRSEGGRSDRRRCTGAAGPGGCSSSCSARATGSTISCFAQLRDRYPGRLGLTLGFDETLAHRIEAGADLFLMPRPSSRRG